MSPSTVFVVSAGAIAIAACSCGAPATAPSVARTTDESTLFAVAEALLPAGEPLADLSGPERTFVCVWELEAEVNNGGFDEYFNSAGDRATDAPAALRAIGAEQTAQIVERANAAFGPPGPPAERASRQRVLLERVSDTDLENATDAFLAYPDPLGVLLGDFVVVHASDIRGAQGR